MSENFSLDAPAWLTGAKETLKKSSGTSFLSIPDGGKVSVRVLPPYKGTGIAAKHVIHWGLTNENGGLTPVKCSYHGPERYCPICDHVRNLEKELNTYVDKDGNQLVSGTEDRTKALKESIGSLKAKTTYLLNVVDFTDGQIKVMQIPKTAFEQLIEKMEERFNQTKVDPTDLTKGIWFTFSRKGKGFNTVYSCDFKKILKTTADGEEAEVKDVSPLSAEVVTAVTSQLSGKDGSMRDLAALYTSRSAAELKSFLDGAPVTNHRNTNQGNTLANKYLAHESESEELVVTPVVVEQPKTSSSQGMSKKIEEMRARANASKAQQ